MLETRDLSKVYDNTILAVNKLNVKVDAGEIYVCLLYTSPSPRDRTRSRMPSSA